MIRHWDGPFHYIFICTKPFQIFSTLILNAVTIVRSNLFAPNAVSLSRLIVASAFHDSEVNRDTFSISRFFFLGNIETYMMQNADHITIRCINVLTIEVPFKITFIVFGEKSFINPNFNKL